MLEHNDDMRIQDGEGVIKASFRRRRKANPHTFDEDFYEPIDRDEEDRIKGTNEYMNSIGEGGRWEEGSGFLHDRLKKVVQNKISQGWKLVEIIDDIRLHWVIYTISFK